MLLRDEHWILIGGALAVFLIVRRQPATDDPGTVGDTGPVPSHDDPATDSGVGTLPTVREFALAIAQAEGFGIPGALPTRNHNPGDLVLPGSQGNNAEGITEFLSDADGWDALYRQLQRIVDGRSRIYTLDDTIDSMAAKWTTTQQANWSRNVQAWLNDHGYSVDGNTKLAEILLYG